jgi:hypothetical protein
MKARTTLAPRFAGGQSRFESGPVGVKVSLQGPDVTSAALTATTGQYDHSRSAGLIDTGILNTVAQSGRTVSRSETIGTMAGDPRRRLRRPVHWHFDRWQCNLRRRLERIENYLPRVRADWCWCVFRVWSAFVARVRRLRRDLVC